MKRDLVSVWGVTWEVHVYQNGDKGWKEREKCDKHKNDKVDNIGIYTVDSSHEHCHWVACEFQEKSLKVNFSDENSSL